MTRADQGHRPFLLVVIPRLLVGGTEKQLLLVLSRLVARGYRIGVFTIRGSGPLDVAFSAAGIEVVNGRTSKNRPNWMGVFIVVSRLTTFLLKHRPSLIHFFLPEAYIVGGMAALFTGTKPRIMSRRSLNRYYSKRLLSRQAERLLHRQMDAVIANSKSVAQELKEEGVNTEKLFTIMNGVDWERFAKGDKEAARKRLGLRSHQLVLACVANQLPYKGHADLFSALGSIRVRLPREWVLLLAGRDDGIERELRNKAHQLDISMNVRWLGERDDLTDVYAASDMGILCSREEGLPNAILEAQASGIPVVVTDAGGSAEVVKRGRTGLVVPARCPERIADAILTLANNSSLRAQMGKEAQIWVRKRFSLGACVDEYQRLYDRLLMKDADSNISDGLNS